MIGTRTFCHHAFDFQKRLLQNRARVVVFGPIDVSTSEAVDVDAFGIDFEGLDAAEWAANDAGLKWHN